ncbi:MAG: transaldolase [Pseudomonadota bacterium]|nr:transaldolase [Pseudomonadota bacterium]
MKNMNVKIFADGADKKSMQEMYDKDFISGLTTNPTLMKNAGIDNYESFCREILGFIKSKPISFEVFSDDFDEMYRQAKIINSWADNIYVKVPISNTKGEFSYELINKLSNEGVKVNVTAIMTKKQIDNTFSALSRDCPAYVSVFAGRIADTGQDPINIMKYAVEKTHDLPRIEIIWASPRELLNIVQADQIGCQIITVTPDILKKISKIGYSLDDYSLDTVKMFYDDAVSAGYTL